MSSAITLTLRPARAFPDVAQLVLGGLVARLHLTVEQLEDLEIAVGELLARQDDETPLTVALTFDDERLEAQIGPLDHESVATELEEKEGLGLRRVLGALVDDTELVMREDGGGLRPNKALAREAE